MSDGRPPERQDDLAALAAVWGREASATAPPVPRPARGPEPEADRSPEGSGDERRRRAPLLVGAAVAVVCVVVAGLVVAGLARDEPDETDAETAPTTTTTEESSDLSGAPAWVAEVTCLALDRGPAGVLPLCPVAADEERAYALLDVAGVPTVRAVDVAGGSVLWEQAVPAGAQDVRRTPAAVVVLVSGDEYPYDAETVALDPVTGAVRWQQPGTFGGLGPDHLLLDRVVRQGEEEVTSTMTVVEAATGRAVVERTGPALDLYLHACGDAGLVVASEGERLTALDLVDGTERWSTTAPHLDLGNPLRCDDRSIAFVDSGTLRLLDAATGLDVGTTTVAPDAAEVPAVVLAVAGPTVVVGSSDGARGFRADADLEQLWRVRCRQCGPNLTVGPAGDGVAVVVEDEVQGRAPVVGGTGPTLDLEGRNQIDLADGTLLAWGRAGVVLADTADLGRPLHLDVDDVRQAAAGSTHLVVSTVDEVRSYPR